MVSYNLETGKLSTVYWQLGGSPETLNVASWSSISNSMFGNSIIGYQYRQCHHFTLQEQNGLLAVNGSVLFFIWLLQYEDTWLFRAQCYLRTGDDLPAKLVFCLSTSHLKHADGTDSDVRDE